MEKHKANYLLLLLTVCIGIHFGAKIYIFTNVENPAVTFRMHTAIQLAYGPLLYLFARKKNDEYFLPSRMWYLFIPMIIVITLYICTSLAISAYPEQGAYALKLYNSVVFLPIVGSHIVFGMLSPVRNSLEMNDKQLIRGLKYVFVALGINEIGLFVFGNMDAGMNPYLRSINYIILAAVPVLTFWFGQPAILQQDADKKENSYNTDDDDTERKPILSNNRHEEIFSQLEVLLREKQLYRDEDLSLEKLASASGINRHHISETLNVFAQKSFYRYINEYRVKEVLARLDAETKKNTRLLTLAYDSGFKTKASFNQYFKKITGTTPSGYLKEKAA
jgi:AraC-like DNA-binding protein